MMRHAFLVIAHNNFGVLQRIVNLFDREGFDFYIHIDSKVGKIPSIGALHSQIRYCEPRVDVRWGDVSQIKCELALLGYALDCGGTYDYYHIISGTHLPVASPDEFDRYFEGGPAAVFQAIDTSESQADQKIRRWNFCTRTYSHPNKLVKRLSQIIWRLSNELQGILGIRRIKGGEYLKASNWCSLSAAAAAHLVRNRNAILHEYKWSFCGDEFFAPSTICPEFSDDVAFRNDYLYQRLGDSNPEVLRESDLPSAKGYLWARKFED